MLDPGVHGVGGRAHALRARRARGITAARPADPRSVRSGAARGRRHAARIGAPRLGGAVPQHHRTLRAAASRDAGLRLRWERARRPKRGSRPTATGSSRCSRTCSRNALRYVPDGGAVELWLDRAAAGGSRFVLGASDDGPGVATEELGARVRALLSRRRERACSGASRDGGGSGLGLAIVREIVERHGGSVRAEGREPRGLTILIEIPAS